MKRTKCTSSHSTHIEQAKDLLKFGYNSPLVTKISLGIIKVTKNSSGGITKRIKCTQKQACLLLRVRGNRAVQEIRFFSKDVEKLHKEILDLGKKLGFETS
jgi:hypothetical protein